MKFTFSKIKDTFRGSDGFGSGAFGASRSGGTRKHNGIDLLFPAGSEILAPFTLQIKRFGKPYADKPQFNLVEFVGFGVFSIFTVKAMYINASMHNVGDIVEKGSLLGFCENIKSAYGDSMGNHLHVEIRVLGKLINPTPFIKLS